MIIKLLSSLLICASLLLATGCVSTVDGRARSGIPTKDKIINRPTVPMQQAVLATRTVLSREGKLVSDDIAKNAFQAQIKKRDVWVKLEEVEPRLTQVTVQARDHGVSDIELAADISSKILLQLTTMQ